MSKIDYSQTVPRSTQIILGSVLMCISLLFFYITAYLGYTAHQNGKLGMTVFAILIGFGSIGFFLSRWSIKLFKGPDAKGDNHFMSSFALGIWGGVFGVASVGIAGMMIYAKSFDGVFALMGGVLITVGAFSIIGKRKKHNAEH